MYCPSVALKFFCQHSPATDWGGTWWMPLHVTDISALIHYATHRTLPDTNVFWRRLIFLPTHLSRFFPLYAKGFWTNRIKISSNYSLVRRETRLSGWSRWCCWMLQQSAVDFILLDLLKGQPEYLPGYIKHTHLILTKMSLWGHLTTATLCSIKHTAQVSPPVVSIGLGNHSSFSPHQNRLCMQRMSDSSHLCLDLSTQKRWGTFVRTHQLKINRYTSFDHLEGIHESGIIKCDKHLCYWSMSQPFSTPIKQTLIAALYYYSAVYDLGLHLLLYSWKLFNRQTCNELMRLPQNRDIGWPQMALTH